MTINQAAGDTPHTWPCDCPYCAAMVIADDGPDIWD